MSTYPNTLFAYLLGPDVEALGTWLSSQWPGVTLRPIDELNADRDDMQYYSHSEERCHVWLEEFIDDGWLELAVRLAEGEVFPGMDPDSDDVRFGELLVDALGGIALVDGERHTDPHSDEGVRVSRDKIELVYAPALDEIDERWTQLIRRREPRP